MSIRYWCVFTSIYNIPVKYLSVRGFDFSYLVWYKIKFFCASKKQLGKKKTLFQAKLKKVIQI